MTVKPCTINQMSTWTDSIILTFTCTWFLFIFYQQIRSRTFTPRWCTTRMRRIRARARAYFYSTTCSVFERSCVRVRAFRTRIGPPALHAQALLANDVVLVEVGASCHPLLYRIQTFGVLQSWWRSYRDFQAYEARVLQRKSDLDYRSVIGQWVNVYNKNVSYIWPPKFLCRVE